TAARSRRRRSGAQRDADLEPRSAGAGVELDRAPVEDDQAVHDRHAEAGPALLGREERLVDTRPNVVGDPGAVVLDADAEPALLDEQLDRDVAAGLDRVD